MPLAGGPQMVEVSRDGRRVYFTNSLYSTWDEQFYGEIVPGRQVMCRVGAEGGISLDDNFCVENAIAYYSALRKQGIAAELHAYETGGHSFAFRATGKPSAQWPKRCEEWMSSRKLLTPAK